MQKKTALILSGGGARGAFQCAAEKYAREVKGYQWDIIAGVSVGALNAAMLGMRKYARLWDIWNTVMPDQVYTGGFNAWSVLKLLFGAKSFYGNKPLEKLLREELASGTISVDVRIGAVSLITGEYVQFMRSDPHLPRPSWPPPSCPSSGRRWMSRRNTRAWWMAACATSARWVMCSILSRTRS